MILKKRTRNSTKSLILCILAVSACLVIPVSADTSNPFIVWEYPGNSLITHAKIASDGAFIIGISNDRSVHIINHRGTLVKRFFLSNRPFLLELAPDDSYFVVIDDKGVVTAFNADGEALWTHDTATVIRDLVITPDSGTIVMGAEDLKVFSRDEGLRWTQPLGAPVEEISVSTDGSLITVTTNGWISTFDGNGNLLWTKQISMAHAVVSPDGRQVFSGRGYTFTWNNAGFENYNFFTQTPLNEYQFTRDSRSIIATTDDMIIKSFNPWGELLWETDPGARTRDIVILSRANGFTTRSDTSLHLFNATGTLQWVYRGEFIRNYDVTADGRYFITTGKNITLLSKETGSFHILSNPAGANVSINGVEVGKTPYFISNLREDDYTVGVVQQDYLPWTTKIFLKAGEYREVHAGMDLEPGSLNAISIPAGAYLYIDGGYKGTTPLTQDQISAGSHQAVLVLDGYFNETATLVIEPSALSLLNVTLTQRPPENPLMSGKNPILLGSAALLVLLGAAGSALLMRRKNERSGNQSRGTQNRAPPSDFPPELLPKYEDIQLLGKGGFGRVYRAIRKKDGTSVALKIPISLDEATGRTFLKEIMNWGNLHHKNIVELYNINILPSPYFEMEYVEKGSLDEHRKPLPLKSAVQIAFDIAEGLKYAHLRGIIHRDLKPHNVMMTAEDVPKIMDWGLSKVLSEGVTTTGIAYSPSFAAPEQLSSEKYGTTDERTDIYQLGVILYELITGRLPFTGDGIAEISLNILIKDPLPPSEISPDAGPLDSIVLKCLKKDKSKRYQRIEDLQSDLGHYLNDEYSQSLKASVTQQYFNLAAEYCGDLILVNLKTNNLPKAYMFATDLAVYAREDEKEAVKELAARIKMRLEADIGDIPEELIQKAEIVIHQVKIGWLVSKK